MFFVIIFLLILPFGLVLLFGAPYLPTHKRQAKTALDMLDLKKGEVFVDLGSGGGLLLIEAAKRGLVCYGYELNPFVWLVSKIRTYKYRKTVTIYCKNFWAHQLPKDTKGVFTFLLDKYMIKLDKKLSQELATGGKLVSYTFKIPSKSIKKESSALYLYHY